MDPRFVVDLYFTLVGLVVGSYLNVLVHRLPRRLSTVLPRSRCPRCRAPIRPWDNIPVLSFLLLRGRCRTCGAPISWRYPLVEILTGFLFWLSIRIFGPGVPMLVAAAFCAVMVVLAMIDLEHFLLPDVLTLPGIAAGLLLVPLSSWSTFGDAWLGAAVGGGLLWTVTWAWYLWKGVHGMGFGDVKMLALIGAFLGWPGVVTTVFIATLLGSAVGLAQMARGRMDLHTKLPFGVFLALGAVWSLFRRDELWHLWDTWSRLWLAVLLEVERWIG